MLVVVLLLGCAERSLGAEAGDEESGEPLVPGEALTPCVDEDDCDVEWCVHPAGEPGFCSFACEDAAVCPDGPSGTATPVCLVVASAQVCALDCGANRTCPAGMRCKQIASEGMARSICF